MTIFYSDVKPLSNILLYCFAFLLLLEFSVKTLSVIIIFVTKQLA